MSLADTLRLSADADVHLSRQRLLRVLQCLAERRAAVSFAVDQWPYVEMRIQIDDADRFVGADISEVVPVGGFVAAAEDDGHSFPGQQLGDNRCQRVLGLFQRSLRKDIANVEWRSSGEVGARGTVTRDEAPEMGTDFPRGLGG